MGNLTFPVGFPRSLPIMEEMTDAELLQSYVRDNSQTAFAALVTRYLDLVYSAALRQLRSSAAAEEVAQSVFLDLSRQAHRLKPGQPLAAWLYLVTRRTAIDAIRREASRQASERAAIEIARHEWIESAMKAPSPTWSQIEGLVDEAIESLNETERSAIVLRFFQNLSLREVGATLGISEDTAQKRVSRALDRLRDTLLRRGIAITAAGLATDLSAHAMQFAPVGLGAAISSAAALSGTAGSITAVEATKVIAMTSLQKTALATACALVVGAGLYEAAAFVRQRSDLAAQEQQTATFTAQLQRVREEEVAARSRLKSIEAQIDSRLASAGTDAALESRLRSWQANLDQLRQTLRQRPNLAIPELQLLTDEDWFDAATKAKLDSDDDVRRTLASLRTKATDLMGDKLRTALNAYLKASDDILPDRIDQLLPFFDPPIASAWLDRYELLQTGKLIDRSSLIIGPRSFGDIEYDQLLEFGPTRSSRGNAMDENVARAWLSGGTATGRNPETAAQFMPYLKWPASEAAVEKILVNRRRGTKR